MSNEWYYSDGEQQQGPVTVDEMRRRIGAGVIPPNAMAWRQGMPAWQPLTVVREEIMDGGQIASTPLTSGHPTSTIAYFNPTGGIDERVARTLKGFPPVTGPRDEWPLSELQLTDLARAEKARKSIRSLSQTMRALGVLWAISAGIFLVIGIFALTTGPRSAGMAALPAVAGLAVLAGLTALAFLAARATLRCQAWAAITFIVLMAAAVLLNLVSLVATGMSSARDTAALMAVSGISCLIPIAILVASVRGLMGIRTFLACPVWAQEALVHAKL